MDPEEISRLAELERKKKAVKDSSVRKPYNPLDWMDLKRTKKWMGDNLALSDKFYSFLVSILIAAGLFTWFYLQDGENWAFYTMVALWLVCLITIVGGFIYGFTKARKKAE